MTTTSKIKVIGASAGSGKTYRLTEELAAQLAGGVRPEAVIAVTFTRAAAEELKARVRAKLFDRGMRQEAHRMEGALIGTVHAVCEALLKRFAFEAGLSPSIGVLPEEEAGAFFEQAVAGVLTPESLDALGPVLDRLSLADPLDHVRQIADLARLNGIPPSALPAMAKEAARGLMKALPKAAWPTAEAADDALLDALDRAIPRLVKNQAVDKTKGTAAYLDALEGVRAKLRAGSLTWRGRVDLCGAPCKKSEALAEQVLEMGLKQGRHPQLREDLDAYLNAVFGLAGQAMERYVRWKGERALIDFTDMEACAYDLLAKPEVRDALREDYALLLVDEFQDTSPLQLALFSRLQAIVRQTVWVGDKKQSIFAFRGADPELMGAAYDQAAEGGAVEALEVNYRSRPELVRFCSDLFAEAFGRMGLHEREVRLKPHRQPNPGLPPALEVWAMEAKKLEEQYRCITQGILQMLRARPAVKIVDPVTGTPRPVRPGDIAVLWRKNSHCAAMANTLGAHGLEASLARTGLNTTHEAAFLVAALQLVLDPGASLPAFTLLHLLDPERPEQALSGRMKAVRAWRRARDTVDKVPFPDAWKDHPYLARLRAIAEQAATLSPAQMVDRVIEAGGLRDVFLSWGHPERRLGNLECLRGCARRYEEHCRLVGGGASLVGLLAWLEELEEGGEQAAGVSERSVHVGTYHKAKGKEWPVVILGGLYPVLKPRLLVARPEALMPEAGGFDLADPLRGRRLRFWPWPYARAVKNTPLWDILLQSEEERDARERDQREQRRLLYVGFTRARDILVLPGTEQNPVPEMLDLLVPGFTLPLHKEAGIHEVDFCPAPEEGGARKKKAWKATVRVRRLDGALPDPPPPADVPWFAHPDVPAPDRPPKFLNASEIPASSSVDVSSGLPAAGCRLPAGGSAVVPLGPRLPFHGSFTQEEPGFGDAVHAYFAADPKIRGLAENKRGRAQAERSGDVPVPGFRDTDRLTLAQRMLEAHDAVRFLSAEALVEAADRLFAWIQKAHPDAAIHRELPIQEKRRLAQAEQSGDVPGSAFPGRRKPAVETMPGPGVQIISGIADLVLEKPAGFVVIDHKGFPGDEEQCKAKALTFAGQLDAYARALETVLGMKCLTRLIHFPVQGLLVEVK